ncbi:MAG: GNAT family N-acetyltransferase [Phycisphaerales bacterium]
MPIDEGGFEISSEKALLDVDAVFDFLRDCYWLPGIARSRVERAIANSMSFGVYDTKANRPGKSGKPKQVGFARVITDKATYGYIADVFIIEEYRGRGLSKMLMKAIVEHPELQGMRRLCLMTRDAHGLYAQFGFAAMPEPGRYMEVVDRESYKRD